MFDWLSLLEWVLATELVILLTAGMFWLVSKLLARESPDDPLVRFYITFWHVMFRKQVALRAAISSLDADRAREYAKLKTTGNVEGMKKLLRTEYDEAQFDDAAVGRMISQTMGSRASQDTIQQQDESGDMTKTTLSVTVVPFSPRVELVSLKHNEATVNVTGGPEEGSSNKAVIDLIAAACGVKGYQLTLVRGHYKAVKVIQIAGIDPATVEAKGATFS